MQKISQANIASLLYLATIFVFFQQDQVNPVAFLVGAGTLTFFMLFFFVIFRLQLNTHFYDRSLTFAQVVASVITMLSVAYLDRTAQLVLGPFLLIAFSYGTFRLSRSSLTVLAAGTIAGYLAMILLRSYREGFGDALKLDLLQWIVVALTLPLMVSVGGRIRQLRATLKLTRRQLQQFEEKAIRDELTGLYNRRQLQTELDTAIARANSEGIPFCLCLIDVDHFKDINDKHGHLVGDVILREFARVALDSIRDSDVIGRYGGDEFMHLLPNTSLKGAVMHAERLRVYAHFLDLQGVLPQKSISLSIGVAQFRSGEDAAALIERADTALYRAKERGRNRVEWIDEE
ncbi:GGDEF domain-containing protein [Actimicrobium antarcticum]